LALAGVDPVRIGAIRKGDDPARIVIFISTRAVPQAVSFNSARGAHRGEPRLSRRTEAVAPNVIRVQPLQRRIQMRRALLLILCIALAIYAQKAPKQTLVKIQKTSMTRDQELQLGKEAAGQVEHEMEVVKNPEIETWLNQIGQGLAKAPEANAYPYYFKLVNEPSINAFALPGGPMYVHTGLLQAADTEGEVAGVLAHEMSHVALRHGAAQMGRQQTWGTLFGLAGAAVGMATAGQSGECGMLCQLGQMGAGIGGNAMLMKFSRGFERDADLNGARMLASSGYDPIGLPTFFEKLQA
jgi:predicted Zn-dependent protease